MNIYIICINLNLSWTVGIYIRGFILLLNMIFQKILRLKWVKSTLILFLGLKCFNHQYIVGNLCCASNFSVIWKIWNQMLPKLFLSPIWNASDSIIHLKWVSSTRMVLQVLSMDIIQTLAPVTKHLIWLASVK